MNIIKEAFEELNNTITESKEDIVRFRLWAGDELADRFFKQKPKIKSPYNDITWIMKHYGSPEDFEYDIKYYEDNPSRKEVDSKAKEGTETVYKDNNWIVLKINSYEASIKYGKHTQWCITGNNSDDGKTDFDKHTESSKIYFYIPTKNNPSYRRGKFALEFKSLSNWVLFDDADYIEVGKGDLFEDALDYGGDYWNPYDCGGKHANFPHIKGLPDINKQYQVFANKEGYRKPLILEAKEKDGFKYFDDGESIELPHDILYSELEKRINVNPYTDNKILYHATPVSLAKKIMKDGFLKGSSKKPLYLTYSEDDAWEYAFRMHDDEREFSIFEVVSKKLDPSKVYADGNETYNLVDGVWDVFNFTYYDNVSLNWCTPKSIRVVENDIKS